MTKLFCVSDRHLDAGHPPELDGDSGGYFSYFQNESGDQSVFYWDFDLGEGMLYCGDAGWEEPRKVDRKGNLTPWLTLSPSEGTWLVACFQSVGLKDALPPDPYKPFRDDPDLEIILEKEGTVIRPKR